MVNGQCVGVLEPGKLADIIVIDGDPLEDITAMSRVALIIKGGEIIDVGSE